MSPFDHQAAFYRDQLLREAERHRLVALARGDTRRFNIAFDDLAALIQFARRAVGFVLSPFRVIGRRRAVQSTSVCEPI